MTTHRSPAEILSALDARERTIRRRSWLLTVVPLLLVFGVYAFLLLRVSDSSKRLSQTQADLGARMQEVEAARKTLGDLNAALDAKRKELAAAELAVAQHSERNNELQNAVDSLEQEQTQLVAALEEPKRQEVKYAEVRDLVLKSKTGPRAKAVSLWNKGYAAFNAGDAAAAKVLYEQARAADPSYAPAVNSLGRLVYEDGDLSTASLLFDQASKLDPNYVPTIHNRALVAKKQGQAEEANTLNLQALKLKPNYAPALMLRESLDKAQK